MLSMICLFVAVICFIFAAFLKEPIDEMSIAWVGMAFFAASFLLTDAVIDRIRTR